MQQALSLIAFRKYLHANPRVSGNESDTSKAIIEFLKPFIPSVSSPRSIKVFENVGKTGCAIAIDSGVPGPVVGLRADIDALPISEEQSPLPYKSTVPGVSHKCG